MQNNQLLVSVIVPMYNSASYIGKTIESILNQTYRNIELIIVDDGSTDKSKEVVSNYVSTDERVKYIYQPNEGAPSARNRGLKMSKGDYVIFFDADDIMLPKSISLFIKNSKNKDLIIGDFINIDENGLKKNENTNYFFKKIIVGSTTSNALSFLPYLDPLPGNKMYKRFFLIDNDVKFSSLKIGQDLNFYLKVIGNNPTFSLLNDVVFQYRNHEGSISKTYNKSILDIINSLKEVEDFKYNIYENDKTILETIKSNHYILQLFKVPYILNKNERKEVYKKLKYMLKHINPALINKRMLKMNVRKANLAINFGFLYTSNLVRNYFERRKNC